jgi:acyl-CoA thioesterase I
MGVGWEMDRSRWCRKAWELLGGLLLGMAVISNASACRLAVLGDSLAAGYGVAEQEAFPVRLEAALRLRGADCTVLNAGVSGDTSAGGAARLDWVLADQPTDLLVELGGNDALRGLPVDQLRANLEQIVVGAQARGVRVLLAGMLAPPNLGREYGDAFRQAYQDVADAHGIAFYPFFLDGAVLQDGLMQADGIHPNSRGVEVIVQRIMPWIMNSLKEN